MIDKDSEYLQGMRDCRDGVRHVAGKSSHYNDGYSCQYQKEQLEIDLNIKRGVEK